jgi:hypothetical protein
VAAERKAMTPAKLILFFLFILSFDLSAQAIIHGEEIPSGEATETVYLDLDNKDMMTCTGVIIAPQVILTAGHCVKMIPSRSMEIGVSTQRIDRKNHLGTFSLSLEKKSVHPRYEDVKEGKKRSGDIQYDIGLLKTKSDLRQIFPRLQFPLLPSSRAQAFQTIQQGQLQAVGYGFQSNEFFVVKKKLPVQSDGITSDNYWVIRSLKKNSGQCEGDSGGGLFAQTSQGRFLLGILSGIARVDGMPWNRKDCGIAQERAAYPDLTRHLCWIQAEAGVSLTRQPLNCP